MPPQYTTESGNPVRLDKQLGKGGEGSVFATMTHSGLVAKIYDQGARTPGDFADFLHRSQKKIRAMIAAPPRDPNQGHTSVAWPQHELLDSGRYVGYLMPRIDKTLCDELYNFYYKRARRSKHPQFSRKHSFQAGRNLAAAVELVHKAGHVVGDMNHANILCQENGLITLIDTDSFQIKDSSGNLHPCTVGMDEYIAPEIQGVRRGSFSWNVAHDHFALGIQIFQLLFGRNPFEGVLRNNLAINQVHIHLIQQRVFPYLQNRYAKPPPGMEKRFLEISDELRDAFVATFHTGANSPAARLKPKDWITLLESERDKLSQCGQCRDWFEPHNTDCTTCRSLATPNRQQALNISPPVVVQPQRPRIAKVRRRLPQLPKLNIPKKTVVSTVAALSISGMGWIGMEVFRANQREQQRLRLAREQQEKMEEERRRIAGQRQRDDEARRKQDEKEHPAFSDVRDTRRKDLLKSELLDLDAKWSDLLQKQSALDGATRQLATLKAETQIQDPAALVSRYEQSIRGLNTRIESGITEYFSQLDRVNASLGGDKAEAADKIAPVVSKQVADHVKSVARGTKLSRQDLLTQLSTSTLR